jgi:hypothetical protein
LRRLARANGRRRGRDLDVDPKHLARNLAHHVHHVL